MWELLPKPECSRSNLWAFVCNHLHWGFLSGNGVGDILFCLQPKHPRNDAWDRAMDERDARIKEEATSAHQVKSSFLGESSNGSECFRLQHLLQYCAKFEMLTKSKSLRVHCIALRSQQLAVHRNVELRWIAFSWSLSFTYSWSKSGAGYHGLPSLIKEEKSERLGVNDELLWNSNSEWRKFQFWYQR